MTSVTSLAAGSARTGSSRGKRWPDLPEAALLSLIIAAAIAAAFPLAWMVLTSLKTPAETMQTPPIWLPSSIVLRPCGPLA